MPENKPSAKFRSFAFGAPLDESTDIDKLPGLSQAQNVIYRPFGSVSKRPGVMPYGAPVPPLSGSAPPGAGTIAGSSQPVIAGKRWYRGRPSISRQTIVQSADQIWLGTDLSGVFTSVGSLGGGSTPAYFAGAYDAAQSGVAGTPASDVLIIAAGALSPRKWDGANLTALSPTITNPFTGCESWHDHVWFWGDPSFPTTVFATDLAQPEGFTFMNTFSPPGYPIGAGDGDPLVQRCLGIGDSMLIFKSASISVARGFDFYTGEYQFTITPLVTGIGTSQGRSVARLRNAAIWWSGQQFFRMAPTDTSPVPIGTPLVSTMALAAQFSQAAIRAFAGDVLISTISGPLILTNVYICAIDSGSGVADTLLVYDDDASTKFGSPAWTVFKGLNVGCFIPYDGPGDPRLLFIGDSVAPRVYRFGANPTADQFGIASDVPIDCAVTTGRDDCGTPDQTKRLNRVYLAANANAATFTMNITSDTGLVQVNSLPFVGASTGAIVGIAIVGDPNAVVGADDPRVSQSAIGDALPSRSGQDFQFQVEESSATSAWSVQRINFHYFEEAQRR